VEVLVCSRLSALSAVVFQQQPDTKSIPVGFLAKVHIYCFLLSYLGSLGFEVLLLLRRPAPFFRTLAVGFAVAGFLAHTSFLLTRGQVEDLPPLLTSQQDWLLVLAWIGSLLYLILMTLNRQLAHGLFLLPAVLLLVTAAIFASPVAAGSLREVSLRRWGMVHAASLVLGIGAVAGAALLGLMYVLHHQRLRNRTRFLMRLTLPSLEHLAAWNRWMVLFSVPCLTIGLLTGFLLISLSRSSGQSGIPWADPLVVITIVVWLAMVAVLIRTMQQSQQPGRSVAMLSFLSGGFLLLTILGLMMLPRIGSGDIIHGRSAESTQLQPAAARLPADAAREGAAP
jgi:hypothetical protein